MTADDSVVDANTSVSLGLIVTELVINALKHAFPGHAPGKIRVEYHSDGPDWTLSVRDDGIGMPTGTKKAAAGLGTGMIEALAKHLGAGIHVTASKPGVAVAIISKPKIGSEVEAARRVNSFHLNTDAIATFAVRGR